MAIVRSIVKGSLALCDESCKCAHVRRGAAHVTRNPFAIQTKIKCDPRWGKKKPSREPDTTSDVPECEIVWEIFSTRYFRAINKLHLCVRFQPTAGLSDVLVQPKRFSRSIKGAKCTWGSRVLVCFKSFSHPHDLQSCPKTIHSHHCSEH